MIFINPSIHRGVIVFPSLLFAINMNNFNKKKVYCIITNRCNNLLDALVPLFGFLHNFTGKYVRETHNKSRI